MAKKATGCLERVKIQREGTICRHRFLIASMSGDIIHFDRAMCGTESTIHGEITFEDDALILIGFVFDRITFHLYQGSSSNTTTGQLEGFA
jgi:hypothetical protein